MPVDKSWDERRKFEVSSWFSKYGKWTLFFSWVPVIGDPLTIVAGVFRVPIYTFILIVSIAKIMRYFFVSLVATNIL